MCILLSGGVRRGALCIEARFLNFLLHLGEVGRWRASLCAPVVIVGRAVGLPQRLLGSFALQGASSSVLKPHLDRKGREKKGVLDMNQDRYIEAHTASVNHFRGQQAPNRDIRDSCTVYLPSQTKETLLFD